MFKKENIYSFQIEKLNHLAGIIPLMNSFSIFNAPWFDFLMPIADDLNLIEKSILECCYAGCKTIWIVSDSDISVLLIKRLGKWIKFNGKWIPIYYINNYSINFNSRKTISFMIIWGVLNAYWVCNQISRWIIPYKFFISFPTNIYPIIKIKQLKKDIHDPNKRLFFSSNENSIKNGKYANFCAFINDFLEFYKNWYNKKDEILSITEIFNFDKIDSSYEDIYMEVKKMFFIDSWDSYVETLRNINQTELGEKKSFFVPEDDKELNQLDFDGAIIKRPKIIKNFDSRKK